MAGSRRLPFSSPEIDAPCYIGIDLGTSGCRGIAIDGQRRMVAEAAVDLSSPLHPFAAASEQDPELWWQASLEVLRMLRKRLDEHSIRSIAVDGTSATLLLADPTGRPLTPALMYNDSRSRAELTRIAAVAPASSPVHSASSSLAKLLHLQRKVGDQPFLALHQADWILGRLCGRFGVSDANNCLKLGFDPQAREWPEWLERLDVPFDALPQVRQPGEIAGRLSDDTAQATGIPSCCRLVSGTTDSNAATLAAGASEIGDAVTSLGSTLVLKILSERPVSAPEYGVYSHRLGDHWLVGGASNSGGAVCAAHFSQEQMRQLSEVLDFAQPTGLDYYPLLQPGERFPLNDPEKPAHLSPRPEQDLRFFQGILEGITRIEVEGYALLQRLGAPPPKRIFSIGGGAANQPWLAFREQQLGVPVIRSAQQQAAYGTALLALRGVTG